MAKVFVVQKTEYYEVADEMLEKTVQLLDVFSTKGKAQRFIEQHAGKDMKSWYKWDETGFCFEITAGDFYDITIKDLK